MFSPCAERKEGRKPLALEDQLSVGIVFDHEHVMLPGDPDHFPPAVERKRHSRGVLEVGHEVEKRRLLLPERLLERVGPDALLVGRDRRDARLEQAEGLKSAEVTGVFGEHDRAFIEKKLGKEFQGLLRALSDDDVIDREIRRDLAEAGQDLLPKRDDALGDGVLERLWPMMGQHADRCLLQGLQREQLRRGKPSGERYHARP